MDKDKIIHSVYYEPSVFSSVQKTFIDAKEKDKTTTLKDVKEWFEKSINRKAQLKG